MKTLYIAIIVVAVCVLFTSVAIFILPIQNQPSGYLLVQTDTTPKNASSIHTCTSKQEQDFDPGSPRYAGLMCPIAPPTYTNVIAYSGFDDVCHDKKYDANNYFLKSGHSGSILYEIYLKVPFSAIFRYPYVDMTNHASFEHFYTTGGSSWLNYTETIDGLDVSFDPRSEMLWPWSSTAVTAKILALHDAKEGAHWLILSPGVCGGGPGFILTVYNVSRIN